MIFSVKDSNGRQFRHNQEGKMRVYNVGRVIESADERKKNSFKGVYFVNL